MKATITPTPEQQSAVSALFTTESSAREKALTVEAYDILHRARQGERLVIDPVHSSLIDWAPADYDDAIEQAKEISFSSNWWVGWNGARCLVCNAFSLQMLPSEAVTVSVKPIPEEALPVRDIMESFVGHPDTANVLGVPYNRGSLQLRKGDVLFVAQVVGGRLPEGCTVLPEGVTIKWFCIELL